MKIFFLGINGISMRGLAEITKENGHVVYGFDDSPIKFKNIQYSETISSDTDLVVYSSAITENHPLRKEAEQKKIPIIIPRVDFFTQYMPFNKNVILVAGAHGKTTTSSIIAYILENKSYYLGGIINQEKSSVKFTKDCNYTVVETDESDGSFLKWKGNYKILLNFDYEHMIFYKNEKTIKKYYYDFIMNNIENTKIIIFKEAKEKLKIPNHSNIITYGNNQSDYVYSNIKATENGINFKINEKSMSIPMLGIHNVYNFTAVYALFEILNEPVDRINSFPGIKKRMQKIKYKNHKLDFFLDYGHHPNEIKSVLESLNQHYPNKKFSIIFEGHKPSRIIENLTFWPKIFKNYDVWIYPIYMADEEEINKNTFRFSTKKFLNFLLNHKIKARKLKKDLSNLELNKNDIICFSAGILSEKLSKY